MPIGINLLPWREQKQRRTQRRHRQAMLAALIGGFIISAVAGLALRQLGLEQQQHLNTLEARLDSLSPAVERLEALKRQKRELNQTHELQKAITRERDRWLAALTGILEAVHGQPTLTRIEQQGQSWRISGHLPETGLLPVVMARLQADPRFTRVDIEYVEPPDQKSAERLRFAIRQTARMP